jgi:DNA-binding NarL/FixJ family response regulator
MPIRVAIVEDDPRFQASLKNWINTSPDISCHQAWRTAEEAIELLPREPPDVLLMDINLPGLSGVECARRIKDLVPSIQIVMLTVYDDGNRIFQALAAGASGYLLKRTLPDKILEAIQEVHLGGAPMSSYIARKVVQSFQKKSSSTQNSVLTEREHEVLKYLTGGYINKEIASAMEISLETVRSHLKSIYEKFHVHSRTEAVVKYLNKDLNSEGA